MRHIGQLPDQAQARTFSEFLVGKKIPNEIEQDPDGTWTVWINDDEQIAEAQEALTRFRAAPNTSEFRNAAGEAAKVRKAQADDLATYRRRVKTRSGLFPKVGAFGAGVLTFGLVFMCAAVAVYSKLGKDFDFVRNLLITDPMGAGAGTGFLPEVFSGEVWRLITPIFLHFGIMHIGFNSIWLFQLGSMIEARQGALRLALLVAIIGVLSNLAQYLFTPHAPFGGMSGVVYGLAGYIWMRGKYDERSGLGLDSTTVTFMMVWLVLCFTGWVGRIANIAHLSGLILGVVWGRVSAYWASRKPD